MSDDALSWDELYARMKRAEKVCWLFGRVAAPSPDGGMNDAVLQAWMEWADAVGTEAGAVTQAEIDRLITARLAIRGSR